MGLEYNIPPSVPPAEVREGQERATRLLVDRAEADAILHSKKHDLPYPVDTEEKRQEHETWIRAQLPKIGSLDVAGLLRADVEGPK